jgi:hypothetical protein
VACYVNKPACFSSYQANYHTAMWQAYNQQE